MRKFLLACLIALLPAVAVAAPFPWTKFSEQAKDAVNAGLASCHGSEVYVAVFEKDGHGYMTFFHPETNRYVVLYFLQAEAKDARATEVGVGKVDMEKAHDVIPPLKWQRIEDVGTPDVCALLDPPSA